MPTKIINQTISVDTKTTKLTLDSTIRSYDNQDTIIQLTLTSELDLDFNNATAKAAIEYYADKKYVVETPVNVSDNTLSFALPTNLKGYDGYAIIGVYVDLADGSKIDIKDLVVKCEPSIIDKGAVDAKPYYFSNLDSVLIEFKQYANSKADELDNDVISAKQEIADKVASVDNRLAIETITSKVADVDSHATTIKSGMDTRLADVDSHANDTLTDVNNVSTKAKSDIANLVANAQINADTASQQVNDYATSTKADMDTAKTSVDDYGAIQKQAMYDVLNDVQSTGDTAKTQIGQVLPNVQAEGEKAKTQINQVLPDVQSKVSAINTELAKIDENMPDLYVAYADDIDGRGFNKTDSSKLYKGYGVKNSNLASDYRWERNSNNLQIGGRNFALNTSDVFLETTKTTTNHNISYTVADEFSMLAPGKTITISAFIEGTFVEAPPSSHYGIDMCINYEDGTNQWVGLNKGDFSVVSNSDGSKTITGRRYSQSDLVNNKKITSLTNLTYFIRGMTSISNFVIRDVKIEIGNVATDWSPAPEDQVSQVELDELKSYIGYTDTDIYGVEIDMVNRRFTRLAGSIGKNAGADFDNINAFKRRRCVLTNDGVVLAYHGESNYTESGVTTTEIVKNTVTYPIGTPVQVMVEQPKFYYKVVPLVVEPIANGKGYHMRKGRYYISDYPKEGFKVHPAFVQNGVVKEKIYLSAYEGSIYDESESAYLLNDEQVADFSTDKLSSIANAKPCSGLRQNLSRANARLLAHNRGNGWEQQTIQTVSLTQLLFLIEYNMFNMQTAIGMGAVSKKDDGSTNMAENTGGTSTLGNATGAVTNTNGIQIISYRGEENPFGNIWKYVDGINVMANGIHAVYVADHDFNDKQSTGSYADVGFTLSKTEGYVSAFGYNPTFDWLFLTSETTGNTSVPVGDYFYPNYTATDDGGWRTVLLCACWNDGYGAGGFYWSVAYQSVHRSRTLSGRLVFIGG